jgi:hypothetical protein
MLMQWCSLAKDAASSTRSRKDASLDRTGVNFCPEAWYLQRRGTAPDVDAMERLRAGSLAQRRIRRATDRLVTTDAIRRGLLIGLIVVALLTSRGRPSSYPPRVLG